MSEDLTTSSVVAPSSSSGVGPVLDLFRKGAGLTRAEVMDRTGLSGRTVNGRLTP